MAGPSTSEAAARPARFTVRELAARDKTAWLVLWKGYCDFYEVAVGDGVTEAAWARLVDPAARNTIGLVACDSEDRPVALAHCEIQSNTWSLKPNCYLEDLFVAPEARCAGAARALIEALAERGRREGWLRIYWFTKADNHRARALYDRVGQLTDWVRYDLPL
ncbi:MAG TPA: GNAT family N-acetyltransferase [Alphaproteobacteria bacterium]|jgi:ribosomal protein S18 acetylase RimI-like enzyme